MIDVLAQILITIWNVRFCLFIMPYGAICAFYEILIDWMENRQGMDNHQHAHVHAHHTITPKSTKRTGKRIKAT